jgi:histidinol dehydrogenase
MNMDRSFIICTQSEEYYSDGVYNAGSVFIGNFTPESAGDYASGTNHTYLQTVTQRTIAA